MKGNRGKRRAMCTGVSSAFPAGLAAGMAELEQLTGDERWTRLAAGLAGIHRSAGSDRRLVEAFRHRVSTRLMEAFRTTQSKVAFGLLYELNYPSFLTAVAGHLRRSRSCIDAQDLVQEVFFNIYRYPNRFRADDDQAFARWSAAILRNLVRDRGRRERSEPVRAFVDDEIDACSDPAGRSPLRAAIRRESQRICSRAYVLYLRLYLAAYGQLNSREQQALRLVEVEGWKYREAAAELGIVLGNFKMLVFRARKKILRTLDRAFAAVA